MATDARRHLRAPQPGDTRSRGPRPEGTWRDVAWTLLGLALVTATMLQTAGLLIAVARLEQEPSTLGLVLGFAITVVWLLAIYWLVMGAWRRSVWGCPFDHVADAASERRCARHRLVEAR